MGYRWLVALACLFLFSESSISRPVGSAGSDSAFTTLTPEERREIDRRLEAFYRDPEDPRPMFVRPPKVDARTGKPLHLNSFLRTSPEDTGRADLETLAQGKLSPDFQNRRLRFRERNASGEPTWSSQFESDQVVHLIGTWMPKEEIAYSLDEIPAKGTTKLELWSSDFWPYRSGGVAYRYAHRAKFRTYQMTRKAYEQPADWFKLLEENLPLAEIGKKILDYSPAEKYDLSVADETFQMTRDQLDRGQEIIKRSGHLPGWAGMCDGWAAASIMFPKPRKPVTVQGKLGVPVEWYPADLKAMGVVLWTNGDFTYHSIGRTCRAEAVSMYPNGRIRDEKCFDVNPASFHLGLGNMIGRKRLSLVMDKNYDYQVWNYPLHGYEFTYFNPLNRAQKSKNWRDVAVPYDAHFRSHDRFQAPLTRGTLMTDGGYDDSQIKQVVGVIVNVALVVPIHLTHGPEANSNLVARVSYTYDLELSDREGKLIPTGGEWHQNAHPDFLWVPEKGAFPMTKYHRMPMSYNPDREPSLWMRKIAQQASADGIPLCAVLKHLWKQSSGNGDFDKIFKCGTDR